MVTVVMMAVILNSCNNSEKNPERFNKTNTETGLQQQKIVITKAEENSVHSKNYQVGEQVPNDWVCMVNNAFMGKPQIAVPVNGKTYYGCCEMCVYRLNKEADSRMTIDPFSGKSVDKSEAYIVLKNANGEVAYFQSEANYKSFSNKN